MYRSTIVSFRAPIIPSTNTLAFRHRIIRNRLFGSLKFVIGLILNYKHYVKIDKLTKTKNKTKINKRNKFKILKHFAKSRLHFPVLSKQAEDYSAPLESSFRVESKHTSFFTFTVPTNHTDTSYSQRPKPNQTSRILFSLRQTQIYLFF